MSTISSRDQLHWYQDMFRSTQKYEQADLGALSYAIYDYVSARYDYVYRCKIGKERVNADLLTMRGFPHFIKESIRTAKRSLEGLSEKRIKKIVSASWAATYLEQ